MIYLRLDLFKIKKEKIKELKLLKKILFGNQFLKSVHGNLGVWHVGLKSGHPKVAMHARLERENGS